MRNRYLSVLGAAMITGTLAAGVAAPVAAARPVRSCGSVSYRNPKQHGPGGIALNDLTASGTTCATARTVARYYLRHTKAPAGWKRTDKNVVVHGNAVGEVIFTRGHARIVGDEAG